MGDGSGSRHPFADAAEQVYQPAEDSELLLSAATDRLGGDERVLEVGTGSGYVAVSVAATTGARVVATDVNPHACRQARERARAAAVGDGVDVVRASLCDPFVGPFDAVLFNPPYLPSDPVFDDWMGIALSGGESGRAVVDPFLDDVARVLAPDGVVLLLVSSLTGVEAVVDRAARNGFHAAAVAEDSFPFETLTVLALRRGPRDNPRE